MILKPPFLVYFQLEMLIYDLKNRNLRAIFGPWEYHFDHFQGQKTRFVDFLKVVLELFKSCLGIIFDLKSHNFRCIFSSKGIYVTSNINFWPLRSPLGSCSLKREKTECFWLFGILSSLRIVAFIWWWVGGKWWHCRLF